MKTRPQAHSNTPVRDICAAAVLLILSVALTLTARATLSQSLVTPPKPSSSTDSETHSGFGGNRSGTIEWTRCNPNNASLLHECAHIKAPLDHANPNASTAISIALARYKATVSPRLGAILINPGGPGGSGKGFALSAGDAISVLTGGQYDIIGFDPRGIGESNAVRCFETSYIHSAFDVASLAVGVPDENVSKRNLAAFASRQKVLAESCGKWSPTILPFLSTTAVARDMDLIRELLGEQVLNYLGVSYGSFLGSVYANLFPQNVGRLMIDGIMDATTYVESLPEFFLNNLVDTKDLFKAFARECDFAGPERCPLAKLATKKTTIKKLIQTLLHDLDQHPISEVSTTHVPLVISQDTVKAMLLTAFYQPRLWKSVAGALAELIEFGTGARAAALFERLRGESNLDACSTENVSGSLGFFAVACLDSTRNNVSLGAWQHAAQENQKISPLFGVQWVWRGLGCRYWPVQAAERYTGPWNHKTKNKILIVGNSFDPVTPLASAIKMEKAMDGNGVLLVQNGYGHTSFAMTSQCTRDYVLAYFVNGTLPKSRTICETYGELFPRDLAALDVSPQAKAAKEVHEFIHKSSFRF
ncbi:hypothetical protein HDU81_003324 [Chytriomyces hyalinus]|nr:hypothetical protein HDU81_003324 [Chytriomyces hyalinus]